MDFRSTPCIFLGYSTSHHGYKCLDPSSDRIYIARHVRFNEHVFPFHSPPPSPSTPTPTNPYVSSYPDPSHIPSSPSATTRPNSTEPPFNTYHRRSNTSDQPVSSAFDSFQQASQFVPQQASQSVPQQASQSVPQQASQSVHQQAPIPIRPPTGPIPIRPSTGLTFRPPTGPIPIRPSKGLTIRPPTGSIPIRPSTGLTSAGV